MQNSLEENGINNWLHSHTHSCPNPNGFLKSFIATDSQRYLTLPFNFLASNTTPFDLAGNGQKKSSSSPVYKPKMKSPLA